MSKISGIHTPAELKNLAINGAFDFFQLVEGTVVTTNSATPVGTTYSADMFPYQSTGPTIKNFSVGRDTTNLPTQAQSGFQSTYSYLFTYIGGTSFASPAAGDYVVPISYRMEGLDYEKIHAKSMTVGFWVNASVPGTYSIAIGNAAGNRSYTTTFTVSGANSWQFISVTIPLDSAGTWTFDNSLGMVMFIGTVAGTTFQTSTLNAWQSGNFIMASTATNWMATAGATLRIAQLSIVEGPLGFSATGFARQGRGIQQELALCQRYIEVFDQNNGGSTTRPIGMGLCTATNAASFLIALAVKKRANPTVTVTAASHLQVSNASINNAATGFADQGCGVDTGFFQITGTISPTNAACALTWNTAAGRMYFTCTL